MARISQAQKHAASVIAHALYVSMVENKVEGMKGFEDGWLKKQSPVDRALVKFFRDEMKRIPADVSRMMDEEECNGSSS